MNKPELIDIVTNHDTAMYKTDIAIVSHIIDHHEEYRKYMEGQYNADNTLLAIMTKILK